MLRFKSEVRLSYLHPQLVDVLRLLTLWSALRAVDVQVNSIDDPAPGRVPGTLHGLGLAIDFESVGNTPADRTSLGEFLRRHLADAYDLVLKESHLHVEWDVHRGPLREFTTH